MQQTRTTPVTHHPWLPKTQLGQLHPSSGLTLPLESESAPGNILWQRAWDRAQEFDDSDPEATVEFGAPLQTLLSAP